MPDFHLVVSWTTLMIGIGWIRWYVAPEQNQPDPMYGPSTTEKDEIPKLVSAIGHSVIFTRLRFQIHFLLFVLVLDFPPYRFQ